MQGFGSMIFMVIALCMQLLHVNGQTKLCDAAAIQTCAPYTCIVSDTTVSCLCPSMTLAQTPAECSATAPIGTTQSPIVTPNQCGNAVCPAGATCVPTNQNPAMYVCICPNNVIGNPNCPSIPPANNPCLLNNPCTNGGKCVIHPLTNSAICICPPNTYGSNCAGCSSTGCTNNWCNDDGPKCLLQSLLCKSLKLTWSTLRITI